jgi:asparagine N-glycosylation enzyme membrane subunit Stt3
MLHRVLALQLQRRSQGDLKMIGTVLLIVLVIMLLGALPTWPYSRSWGYYPSGGLGTVLVIIIVLLLLGYI